MKQIFLLALFLFVTWPGLGMDKDYYFTKCDFYLQMEDYHSAQNMISLIDPNQLSRNDRAMVFNKKGFIQYKLDDFPQALTNYFMALKLNPSLEYVYNNVGVIYFKKGDHTRAREYYLKAISINSNYPRVLVNLAVNEFYIRNYTLAFQWYMKALKADKAYVKERFDREKGLKKLLDLAKKYPEDQELQFLIKWAEENKNKDIADY